MATQTPTENAADVSQANSLPSAGDKPKTNKIIIGQPFEAGGKTDNIIRSIQVGEGPKLTSGWKVKEDSVVTVEGTGLGIYNQIALWIGGGRELLTGADVRKLPGETGLEFTARFSKNSYGDGSLIGVEFLQANRPDNDRTLEKKFLFSVDEEKDQKDKGGESEKDSEATSQQKSGGPVDIVMGAMGDTIGGIAEALGAGPASSDGMKTMSNSGTSASLGQNVSAVGAARQAQHAQNDYDDDASSETSERQTAASSTTGIFGGAQAISEGGTVKQTRTTEVSSGGTVSASQGATVSGTVAVPQSGSVSGTVGVAAGAASASATVSGSTSAGGGGASTISLSGAPQAAGGGSAAIEGTTESRTNVTGEAQGQTPVAGGANVQTQVSGTANINQISSTTGTQAAAGVGAAPISQGGTAALGLNLAASGTVGASLNKTKASSAPAQNRPQPNAPAGQGGVSASAAAPQALQTKAPASTSAPTASLQSPSFQSPSAGKMPARIPASKAQSSPAAGKGNANGVDAAGGDQLPASPEKRVAQPSPAVQQMINRLAEREKAPGNLNLPVARHGTDPGILPQSAGNISTASGLDKTSDAATAGGLNSQRGQSQAQQSSPTLDQKPGTDQQPQTPGSGGYKNPLASSGPGNADQTTQDEENPDEPENQPAGPPNAGQKQNQDRSLPSRLGRIGAKQKLLGKVSNRVWKIGFGTAAGVGFTGLDFFVGAIIMDYYWIFLHRKDPESFPLKRWQKFMTVVAHVLPFVYISIFLVIVLYAGCNLPSSKASVLTLAGYGNVCQSVNGVAGSLSTSSLNLNNPATNPTTVTGACVAPLSGDASVAYMANTCFGPVSANTAAVIAAHESGGNPTIPSGVDICHDASGNKVMVTNASGQQVAAAVSFGLFQINITSHQISGLNCPAAFSYPANVAVKEYDANNHQCTIVDQTLYNSCVQAAEDASQNVNAACQISRNGTNWNAWKADINACGITSGQ